MYVQDRNNPADFALRPSFAGLGAPPPPGLAQVQFLLAPLMGQVQGGLDDLVNTAKTKSAEVAQKFKGDWFNQLRAITNLWQGFSTRKIDRAADDWVVNIVGYAENVRASLSRPDDKGQPLYVRRPEEASRLLGVAKKHLNELIKDFSDAVEAESFSATVSGIIDQVIKVLAQIAEVLLKALGKAAVAFPFVAAAAVVGAIVYFKYFRK